MEKNNCPRFMNEEANKTADQFTLFNHTTTATTTTILSFH